MAEDTADAGVEESPEKIDFADFFPWRLDLRDWRVVVEGAMVRTTRVTVDLALLRDSSDGVRRGALRETEVTTVDGAFERRGILDGRRRNETSETNEGRKSFKDLPHPLPPPITHRSRHGHQRQRGLPDIQDPPTKRENGRAHHDHA